MKKQLLTVLAVCMAIPAGWSQSNDAVYCDWGKLIDGETTAGDQSTDVCLDKQGNVYWFGTYGTKENLPDITFDGEYLYTGAPYHSDGTSQNPNFTVLKTDSDGNKLWCVYSNMGDFEANSGGCALTSDGGIVVTSKIRHTDQRTDQNLNIVDAEGNNHEIAWTLPETQEARIYRLMVTKISPEGEVEWIRTIEFSTEPGPSATGSYAVNGWTNSFNIGDVAVDANDNIFIGLNYKNTVTFNKADGTTISYTPLNNKTWTGDSQVTCGDFMLLKLDSNGYYSNALTLEGTASAALCQKVRYSDGYVYAQGYIQGDGTTLKCGDFTFEPNSDTSPVLLCTDPDLNVKWAKCYKGEKVAGKSGFQNVGLRVCNGILWMCGQYNIKFADPDDPSKFVTSTQGAVREGFVIKLDAATGEWLGARNSRDDDWNYPSAVAKTGLTGYFDILINPDNDGKFYVFGYVMNADVGVFLREYDTETLEGNLDSGQNNVVTAGGVPTCQAIAYDSVNGAAYLTVRGNKAFNMKGATTTEAPSYWGILATKVILPDDMVSTGAAIVSMDAEDGSAPVEYYTLQGIRVSNPRGGIFIRRQGNKAEKVIL